MQSGNTSTYCPTNRSLLPNRRARATKSDAAEQARGRPPGVGAEASAAAAYLNNSDNVFIVQDMNDKYRVVGCDKWLTKTTVNQDNGQGASGTTSTTINVEASDEVPAPFYDGEIVTEDGIINPSKAA